MPTHSQLQAIFGEEITEEMIKEWLEDRSNIAQQCSKSIDWKDRDKANLFREWLLSFFLVPLDGNGEATTVTNATTTNRKKQQKQPQKQHSARFRNALNWMIHYGSQSVSIGKFEPEESSNRLTYRITDVHRWLFYGVQKPPLAISMIQRWWERRSKESKDSPALEYRADRMKYEAKVMNERYLPVARECY